MSCFQCVYYGPSLIVESIRWAIDGDVLVVDNVASQAGELPQTFDYSRGAKYWLFCRGALELWWYECLVIDSVTKEVM